MICCCLILRFFAAVRTGVPKPAPRYFFVLLLAAASTASAALVQPWQKISDLTAAEAAVDFASPPPEYSAQFTWGWGRDVSRETMARDLDGMKALGVRAAIVEPTARLTTPYLSPGWFDLVRIGVEEAKKRDMRLWFMDDGDYPSGLAGGKFTRERPELRMQALAKPENIALAGGEKFSRAVPPDLICAVAVNKKDGTTRVLDLDGEKIEWTAPENGAWEIVLTSRVYRTMPTRSANNPNNVKDTTQSLMDYLDPAAAKLFIEWTFDAYAQAVGGEFGKTVLGFRGDEPAYGFNPWTPKLFAEFQKRKGYDLRPFIGTFAAEPGSRTEGLTDAQRRAYADYCDVWSDLYRDSYFNAEAEWCAAHGLTMQLHVEHEEILPQLAIADGDYFKCFRQIQEPGIDIIWHQIWMDNPADFPKLASSAAHLYGRPRAMCEAFAAYRPPPNLKQARWLLDFLMTRGINRIEYMAWTNGSGSGGANRVNAANGNQNAAVAAPPIAAGSAQPATNPPAQPAGQGFRGPRYYREPEFPATAAYVNRLSYLLGAGRPAAQIGLYIPSSSFWLGGPQQTKDINAALLTLAHQLIEHQRDFDFVDEQALTSVLKLDGNRFVNLSGQSYRAIVVPPTLAISRRALERLRDYAQAGGTVIFIGAPPSLVSENDFLHASGPAEISWATLHQTQIAVTPAVLAALPTADLALEKAAPLVSYAHRCLRDADVYFIFNSGDETVSQPVVLAGQGAVQTWNPNTGEIAPLTGTATGADRRGVRVPLELAPWSTTTIVIGGAATAAVASGK
jgi:hypothetical protein